MSLIRPFANFNPQSFTVVVTCADGLENALLIELGAFGLVGKVERVGRVATVVDLSALYRLFLYSRVASRILLPIGDYQFKQKKSLVTQHSTDHTGKKISRQVELVEVAEDVPSALYEFVSRYDWTSVFGLEQTFAIRLSTDKRLAVNQQFATLRIKDAVADSFNAKLGKRPDVDTSAPNVHIFANANSTFAELFIDLSGVSLHRRGYRVANTAAPLKENLAAALLYESGWHKGEHDALIDPMCGSGTFISEALLMRADYPVGLDKVAQFGFYHWAYHDESLWQGVIEQATADFDHRLDELLTSPISVIALDADPVAVQACHRNLLASAVAPLATQVYLQSCPLSQLADVLGERLTNVQNPFIITNPPYGERLGDSEFIKPLYQGLGLLLKDGLSRAGVMQASLSVLASHVEEADTLPIDEPRTLRCHNGALTVYFRHGRLSWNDKPSLIESFVKKDITAPNQEFINRLQKNLAHLKKLAKAQGVTNLRVYDADLPNYNVAIDLYGDKIHVQEYAPPKQIPPEVAKQRFNQVLSWVREVFGVPRESIFIKTRARQSGNEQYSKNPNADNKRKKVYLAKEDGAYFYVNFSDYLDTGLFIDHRLMRQRVKQASPRKRVLNLFAYTCSASVHSAVAGAMSVTSVDLSENYLTWGKQNFALNGLVLDATDEAGDERYQFIGADVFEWIKDNTAQYDVIFIDPPTFSNSKKFQGTFDVQRDHVALINRAMNRLAPNGVLYFSNNYTRFVLDEQISTRYQVENITDKTIGFDFDIKKPIHQSYEIRHKGRSSQIPNDDFEVVQSTHLPKLHSESSADNKPVNKERAFNKDKSFNKDKAFNKERTFKKDQSQDKTQDRSFNKGKPFNKDKGKSFNKDKNFKDKPFNKGKGRPFDDKKVAPSTPPKPKVRYDKIDGKLVATVITDDKE